MHNTRSALTEQYAAGLQDYLAGGGETALQRAYDLGRKAIAEGVGVLGVADTGPGIPTEIQARIFEPFFTTKPLGVGTGLGLSLCQGIIEGHGGTIRLASTAEQGAVFRIDLPVTLAK